MEIDTVLEASKDFEKKGKREACHVLDQLLCHVAKTGETMIPWSQFKSYFLFKLETVIDDFQASTPEQRGLVNPNVECVPFEEIKDRILKIVNGYNGIPFTIQRLCELLTDPKRNYTGTEKFLRGVEKNVMVVSCVCPTSDKAANANRSLPGSRSATSASVLPQRQKNGVTSVNRMNGVMFPGNSSVYSDSRNMNGPGTPKPFSRPKLSLSSSPSTNGLPDCSDDKGAGTDQGEGHTSDSLESEGETPNSSVIKNKHPEGEDTVEADRHEVKRLKFDQDEEDRAEREGRGESGPASREESSSDAPESSTDGVEEDDDDKTDVVKKDGEPADVVTSDDQEPTSTQTEPLGGDEEEEEEGETEEREAAPGPVRSPQGDGPTDPSGQPAQSGSDPSPKEPEDGESADPVSSSSGGEEEGTAGDEPVPASPGSTAESPADGAAEASSESLVTAAREEAMEQD